jgi:hypothetical protein
MIFDDIKDMKDAGFQGFCTIESLIESGCSEVPLQSGVFLVVWPSESVPQFLQQSAAEDFKGRNPSLPEETLQDRWVQGAKVVFIGRAGGESQEETLQWRLRQYMRAGQGRAAGRLGESLIWQIKDCLLVLFEDTYGGLPFANLRM